MITKEIKFKEDARTAIFKGIETLASAVKSTLGPAGRNVIIEHEDRTPVITKDGVTVAKNIKLADRYENIGAQMIKEVSMVTADTAGDGTTTATVLAEAVFAEGLRNVVAGANPIDIQRGINKAASAISDNLTKISTPVKSKTDIKQIATVSSNWDNEVGEIISNAISKVGRDGSIAVEEGNGRDTVLSVVEGMQVDSGYLSPIFITDEKRSICEMEGVYIFLTEMKVTNLKPLLPVLERASRDSKPLLIIAEEVSGEALSTLVVNKTRGSLEVCAINAPSFGDNKNDILDDIAVLTGAKVITELNGGLKSITDECLGTARRVVTAQDSTTIIEGGGNPSAIESKRELLRLKISKKPTNFLKERLAKLSGGVGVIRVGGNTDSEMKEKKARVEDALHATRCAIEAGIVIGGGCALIEATKILPKDAIDVCKTPDERLGFEIMTRAVSKPLEQLVDNSGKSGEVIVGKQYESTKDGWGYDVITGEFVNMFEMGIIDPTKVTKTALINSASISGLLLTTECVIINAENT